MRLYYSRLMICPLCHYTTKDRSKWFHQCPENGGYTSELVSMSQMYDEEVSQAIVDAGAESEKLSEMLLEVTSDMRDMQQRMLLVREAKRLLGEATI